MQYSFDKRSVGQYIVSSDTFLYLAILVLGQKTAPVWGFLKKAQINLLNLRNYMENQGRGKRRKEGREEGKKEGRKGSWICENSEFIKIITQRSISYVI